ncbi:hypothetical protein E4U22_003240 [Claviceps purpurea]|uniref:Related to phosphatidylinositol phospholipase n=1 Tax=Claviceps purpurea (strain 20.1) TaxID=1111077 RepID=M1W1N1_CLAP2|nr:hypothetical protein E4U12_004139 [Claviceps purpurea]CCE31091.1 related to phosphatidylinositol phospholipase [Claviceps purpurea 20.1]KAG6131524.1 hypothetical protein E4U28_006909 [Claviceps purpurea]KAG6162373.1 hypothetical protein E4U11_002728 [Claviceps purpurea]KAG6185749.1 hypothetical protein E4U27_000330 [Claviceps purpurea]
MATLTIRNLTIHPLDLLSVHRFQSSRIKLGSLLQNVSSSLTGFLNATEPLKYAYEPIGDPLSAQTVSFHTAPFQTTHTDIPPTDLSNEVIRLTFRTEGDHHYEADVPSMGTQSAIMRKLTNGPHDLTIVYIPSRALLTVFSSAKLQAWMQELRDEWPLTLLSIPGTHNSPTCHRALPSVRCQATTIEEQLENGVRFLDIRVSAKPDDDALALVHGAFPISMSGTKYFGDMLEDVYRFLEENPSEAVLMSVKREGTGKATDGQMGHHLKNRYTDKRADRWWTDPRVPTLGEARGKIVLVRRFGLDDDMRDGGGYGVDAQEWPDNCEDGLGGGGGFRIQDFYEISESQNIDKKIEFTRRQLERAAEQTFALAGMPNHDPEARPPPFFVNFLTASNFFNATCWPERIAAKVNPAVIDYLCGHHGDDGKGPLQLKVGCASTGIVVTDWVGAFENWDLVRCIVGMNARLQHLGSCSVGIEDSG